MVVDDHDFCRDEVVAALGAERDLEVVGDCADGVEAVRLADRIQPDVIVMDLQMPRMNGAEASREILRRHPQVRIVVVTGAPHSPLAREAMAAGAYTGIAKSGDCHPLLAAIRAR